MDKNAISVLQEFSQKNNSFIPKYIIIEEKNGSHINSFTYKVVCDVYSINATANSKKAAKLKVAEDMIGLLQKNGFLINYKKKVNDSFTDFTHSTQPTDDDNFTNSVGLLQEFCVQNKLKSPQYKCTDVTLLGEFTQVCELGDLKTSGTSNSKKKAKQLSAEKMLKIIYKEKSINHLKFIDDNHIVKIDELKLDELKMDDSRIYSEAKSKYKKIMNNQSLYDTSNVFEEEVSIHPIDYHTHLKNSLKPTVLINIKFLLNSVDCEKLNNNSGITDEIIDNICQMLKVNLKELEIKNSMRDAYLFSLSLSTIPIICEMGLGKSLSEAKFNASVKIIKYIKVLFN